jgi:hypothetical protein
MAGHILPRSLQYCDAGGAPCPPDAKVNESGPTLLVSVQVCGEAFDTND